MDKSRKFKAFLRLLFLPVSSGNSAYEEIDKIMPTITAMSKFVLDKIATTRVLTETGK